MTGVPTTASGPTGAYALRVGAAGRSRLELVQDAYGGESKHLLARAGLRPGHRVADVGCGTGTMSRWIAAQVGAGGEVVGVDASPAQLAEARGEAPQSGAGRLRFVEGSAYETGLERGSFDVVYSRFLLMHLARPEEAIAHMRSLLVPGGVLACEEAPVSSSFCEPEVGAQRELQRLVLAMSAGMGVDFDVARRLFRLVRDAGLVEVDVRFHQPVFAAGETKRLEELSFLEVADRMVASGVPREKAGALLDELHAAVQDQATLYALSRMVQVSGRQPTGR